MAIKPPTIVTPESGKYYNRDSQLFVRWIDNAPALEIDRTSLYWIGLDPSRPWDVTLIGTYYPGQLGYGSASVDIPTGHDELKLHIMCYGEDDENYSEVTFRVESAPQVELEIVGAIDGIVNDYPLLLSGRVQGAKSCTLTVNVEGTLGDRFAYIPVNLDENGRFTAMLDSNSSVPIADRDHFEALLSARTANGVLATVAVECEVAFAAPHAPQISIVNDKEDGTSTVRVMLQSPDETFTEPLPERAELYRVTDDGRFLVWESTSLENMMEISDEFPPLNVQYQYDWIGYTSAGLVGHVVVDNVCKSPFFFLHWSGGTCKARWNPEGSWGIKPAQVELNKYMGRVDPVMSRGTAVDDTASVSFDIVDPANVPKFKRMVRESARAYYRGADGVVMNAYVTVSGSPKYTEMGHYGGIQVNLTRIAGDER